MPKLTIDAAGRLQCASNPHLITHNYPWPSHNGSTNFQEPADGYVIHTEVGYEHSVEEEFNNPAAQASAFVSIGDDGHIHQYGPIGHGWKAWTQAAGNAKYRGAEHEDLGHPSNPLTAAQIESSASVLEAISEHDKFPLQPTDNPNGGKGVIFHSDGGAAWGGHDCPGQVRRGQRGAVIDRAKAIRGGTPVHPDPVAPPIGPVHHVERVLHLPITGHWSHAIDVAAHAVLYDTHGATHSAACRYEQQRCGTSADGVWGYLSRRARKITVNRLQGAIGAGQDGIVGKQTLEKWAEFRAKFVKADATDAE